MNPETRNLKGNRNDSDENNLKDSNLSDEIQDDQEGNVQKQPRMTSEQMLFSQSDLDEDKETVRRDSIPWILHSGQKEDKLMSQIKDDEI